MKKRNTAALSLTRSDTGRRLPALAARIVRAALLYAGILALAQGAAGIWQNSGWLWAAAGCAALIWQSAVLHAKPRWLRVLLPLLCLLCTAVFPARVLAGAITVCRSACTYLTETTGRIFLPPAGQPADAWLFICVFAALIGAGCAYAVRYALRACSLLLTALFAALLLTLRPDAAQLWMAVCPLSAAFLLAGSAADRSETGTALRAQGALLAAAGLLTASLLAIPAVRSGILFSDWRAAGADAVHQARYEAGQRVLPEGRFDSFVPAPEQTPCLRVTMSQPTTLYLRGFTADVFTGAQWQALPASALADESGLIYWLHKSNFYPQAQLAAAVRALQTQVQTQTVRVENTGACSAYVYLPYSLTEFPQNTALRAESLESTLVRAIGLRGMRSYQFTMPCAPEQTAADTLDLIAAQPAAAEAYLSQEGSYRAFVQTQDLALPEQAHAQLADILDEICREYGPADSLTAEQAQICVARFLEQLDALRSSGAPLPLDSSAAGTSYQTATLTVLALRYYGIPARYAEGFVLTSEAAARAAADTPISLTAADAQAWAEIYQDGLGWLPLALTPGYGDLTDILSPHQSDTVGQTDDTDTDNGAISQAQTVEEESDETEDTPQDTPENSTQPSSAPELPDLLWWLLPAGILLLLLAAIVLRYLLTRRRWQYRFTRTAPAQAVTWVTRALPPLWNAMRLGYDGSSVFAFGDTVRAADAAYAETVLELAALNGEARFSDHPITPEQAERARQIWQQSVSRLQKTEKPLRRIWLKWIRCLY